MAKDSDLKSIREAFEERANLFGALFFMAGAAGAVLLSHKDGGGIVLYVSPVLAAMSTWGAAQCGYREGKKDKKDSRSPDINHPPP